MAERKAPAKPPVAEKAPVKQPKARKAPATPPAKRTAAKKAPAKGAAKKPDKYLRRDDLGAPVEVFFAKHGAEQRALLETLHALIKKAAPAARESIKWGMPCFELKSGFCALYTSPTYVGLNIMAPPEKLDDPEGRLEGTGKTMRHLKVRSPADIDEPSILRWLQTAAAHHS